jgi:hypothetical protein
MLMAGACFMPEKSACSADSVLSIGNWNAASERDNRNRFGGHLNDCSRPYELAGFFLPPAPQGSVETVTNLEGEWKQPAVTVKLDGLASRIEHYLAMVTEAKMFFQVPLQVRLHFLVEVARNLLEAVLTV